MTSPTPTASASLSWQCSRFEDLAPRDLYALMELRQRVFVVEQHCVYMDADGADDKAIHLLGWSGARLVACARLFPPRVKYAESSIGRVATHPDVRGTGVGQSLMTEAMMRVEELGWGREIRIAAQMYLEKFYEGFGFKRVTEPYTEDDIWHVDMLRG